MKAFNSRLRMSTAQPAPTGKGAWTQHIANVVLALFASALFPDITQAQRPAALIGPRILQPSATSKLLSFDVTGGDPGVFLLESSETLKPSDWRTVRTLVIPRDAHIEEPFVSTGAGGKFYRVRPSQASVFGRVTLSGTPPSELTLPFDANCARYGMELKTTRHYVVSPSRGLANVIVSIKSPRPPGNWPAPSSPLLVQYRQCNFQPYIQAGRTFQPILVQNTDPFLHNCHIQPTVTGNKESNFALVTTTPKEVSFSSPEMFLRMKCEVHPWEFFYVCLFDHPFFAITDAEGNFSLPAGLPAGDYILEANHRRAGAVTVALRSNGSSPVRQDLNLQVP